MKNITVFYDGKVYAESDDWIRAIQLPASAYIRSKAAGTCFWYRVVGVDSKQVVGVNERDIPTWIKAWLLVLS